LPQDVDHTAIARIRAGDTGAYADIMRRYNQRLFRVARSILQDDDAAQDAMQEAYVNAYFKLDKYAPTGSFGAWLTRITVNEALMMKRKDRRIDHDSAATPADRDPERAAPRADPADRAANRELAGLIETAVDALPEDFRTVFVLRALQQLSVHETAASLGINEATVKTRLYRARALMQKHLDKHIAAAGMAVFEFAGRRCDNMVSTVLKRLDNSA
jgi:RNA polymerase sigma-70 factor (ECF subfamily)